MTPIRPDEPPRHSFGWIDRECAQIASCNGEPLGAFIIEIDEWRTCPKCGKELKLAQRNDVLVREVDTRV